MTICEYLFGKELRLLKIENQRLRNRNEALTQERDAAIVRADESDMVANDCASKMQILAGYNEDRSMVIKTLEQRTAKSRAELEEVTRIADERSDIIASLKETLAEVEAELARSAGTASELATVKQILEAQVESLQSELAEVKQNETKAWLDKNEAHAALSLKESLLTDALKQVEELKMAAQAAVKKPATKRKPRK